jgi:predicted regulator of Ras-like GTPase activity (Roadblock/LC7/MglB family)
MTLSNEANSVNWLMASFVERTPGANQAIAVSSDGLLIAMSATIDRSSADKLAAIITGMRALSHGAANELAKGPVVQVLIEMANAYLFVSSISGGSTLGVVTDKSCDLGLVGYEIAMLVDRVGAQLSPSLVTELKNSLVGV